MSLPVLAVGLALMCAGCAAARGPSDRAATDSATEVRIELERLYALNAAGFMRHDIEAVMALRAADFHTVAPDGKTRDRAEMRLYMQGIMNGIRKWNEIAFTIDSLTVTGDTAYVVVAQYLDRMALRPDERVHHVQTWVTQREIWVRSRGSWLMWRVDQVRDQRRLVDGRPG